MRSQEYGQFCGLARAAEVLEQRWTLLIVRDLLVAPRRYSELRSGLPGIPTNMLATRLKGLENDGLVVREARSGADRSVIYRLTTRGEELAPALDALARWGAASMHTPREGEVITEASLATALRAAAVGAPETTLQMACTVQIGDAIAHAEIADRTVVIGLGAHPDPDLVIRGDPTFRYLLAGELDAKTAVAEGTVEIEGDAALLTTFLSVFHVPYTEQPT